MDDSMTTTAQVVATNFNPVESRARIERVLCHLSTPPDIANLILDQHDRAVLLAHQQGHQAGHRDGRRQGWDDCAKKVMDLLEQSPQRGGLS